MTAPNYKAFAEWAIREGVWDGWQLDGDEIQDKAVEFGIIEEVEYDPVKHGENDVDAEPGDPWFVFVKSDDGAQP